MKKTKGNKARTGLQLSAVLVWFWVALILIDISFLIFFYFIWVLIGLCIVGTIIWNKYFKHSFTIGIFIAFSIVILTPIIGFPSALAYRSFEEKQTVRALDRLIQILVDESAIPNNYQIKESEEVLKILNSEISAEYDILFIDFLLGEYDIGVKFNSGAVYAFQIGRYDRTWQISIFKQ